MKKEKVAGIAIVASCLTLGCGNDRRSLSAVRASLGPTLSEGGSGADRGGEGRRLALRDDCDPRDPAWAPTGGCALEEGDVTTAEFFALLNSPPSSAVVGHPAWTIDPTHLRT